MFPSRSVREGIDYCTGIYMLRGRRSVLCGFWYLQCINKKYVFTSEERVQCEP
jgi:hypothetical protein